MSNDDELKRILRQAWDLARPQWPQIELPYQDYADFVLHLSWEGVEKPTVERVESMALMDLYLVLACLRLMPYSVEALEDDYLSKLPGLLAYLKLSAMDLDEVCQLIRIHLLVGTARAGPQLNAYLGRGPLLNWIKVIAVRMALRQSGTNRESAEEGLPDELSKIAAPGADPEFELIKRRFSAEFHQAMEQAIASLSREQRYLLRLNFMDRLSTIELGTLFGKDQSTTSRWLKTARETVYERTKHFLQARLGLSTREFASLLAAVRSQLDVYISQFLSDSPAGSSDDPALDRLLNRAWEIARARWPQVHLPYSSYAGFVQHRCGDDAEKPTVTLAESLALVDLYLSFACLRNVKGAVEVLEEDYLGKLPSHLAYLRLSPMKLDEVCQMVRSHLLVGTPPAGPRLNEYKGRGSLLTWMNVIAVRMALQQEREDP